MPHEPNRHPAPAKRRGRYAAVAWTSLWASTSVGCNSFDPPPPEGAGTVRVAPTDEREPVIGSLPPAPVMGSNLVTLRSNGGLLVSDADRDRVSLVSGAEVVHVPTGLHTRPNRATEDDRGNIHVTLRGTGELLALSSSGEPLARSRVCRAPRGVAFDPASQDLVVACAEGRIVRHSLDPASYASVRSVETDVDLRDVVVQEDRVYVSRLRSAEVLEYRGDDLFARHRLPTVELTDSLMPTERAGSRFQATVAWKMVPSPEGDGVIVLHQRALLDTVGDTAESNEAGEGSEVTPSSYGGSDPQTGCSSIVQPAVSEVHVDGSVVTSDSIAGVVLAVDLIARTRSIADTSERGLVLASAGVSDPNAPRSTVIHLGDEDDDAPSTLVPPSVRGGTGVFAGNVRLHGTSQINPHTGDVRVGCITLAEAFGEGAEDAPTVSVAGVPGTDEVIAFRRDPNVLLRGDGGFFTQEVDLNGDPVTDTGHDLFHRDSGGGIACASCHPEAEDDGHVWTFASVGARRTQFLGGHLSETAPFHWDGSLADLGVLMDEVFVTRMGGVFQSPARVEVLANWLGHLPETSTAAPSTTSAVTRGQELFESPEVGCSTCHSGAALTDNKSHAIGTTRGLGLQTPSLRHVSLHPPFMHDGCAKTLRERFVPECGGDEHGRTSHLTDAQLDDLVAYMGSL